MTQTLISTALPRDSIDAMLAALLLVAESLSASKVVRTRAEGRVRPGQAVPDSKISASWHACGSHVTRIEHVTRDDVRLHHETEHRTVELHLGDVLTHRPNRAACLRSGDMADALRRLATALSDARIKTEPPPIRRLADLMAVALPQGCRRPVTLHAPSPFRAARASAFREDGSIGAQASRAGERAALAALGRPVLVDVPNAMRASWRLQRPFGTSSSAEPDPMARLRLIAEAARMHGPLMEPVPRTGLIVE